MNYSPVDILDYVLNNEKEAEFMVAMTMHKMGYSIAEITDAVFKWKGEELILMSKSYNIRQVIDDPDIYIAAKTGKYISAFISRYNDMYQIHFLVHECMTDDKNMFEEDIFKRVVQYMILKTIKQLRLDTPQKVEAYITN